MVSTSAAVTSISLCNCSSAIRISTWTVLPTLTVMPVTSAGAKSGLEAVAEYWPGFSVPAWKRPSESLRTVREMPLSMLFNSTAAAGMTPPSGPMTTPTMRPRWASN